MEIESPNLSQTLIKNWNRCNRYAYYYHWLNLDVPKGLAAQFSVKLIHQPLADLYSNKLPNWNLYEDEYLAEFPKPPQPYTATIAEAIYHKYVRDHYDENREVVAVEKFASFPTGNYTFVSKPDVVFRDGGKLTVCDFKASKYEQATIPWALQFITQAWSVGADAIEVVRMQLADDPIIVVDRLEKDAWAQYAGLVITGLTKTSHDIEQSEKINIWPQNADGCFAFNRPCEFMKLCTNNMRQDLIDGWPKRQYREK